MNRPFLAVISVAVLGAGIGINQYLVKTKPAAKKVEASVEGVAVEVITVGASSSKIQMRARGTVMPAREVVLGTEVGGKVIKISPDLQPGGKFIKGDLIARIDPSDYRIAVEQSFAMVDSAQAQLSIEESRKAVAEREWEMFGGKSKVKGNKQLALREPQMRSATTQLKSARSGLKRARLGVERTLLRAPFDGMVQTRNVELGQIVGPGAPLIKFVGTKSYWVQVSLPIERLAWISVPGFGGTTVGSLVKIHHKIGHEHIEREGRVLRLLGEVDPAGRMARILIEVDDPLGLEAAKAAADVQDAPGTEVVVAETPKESASKLPLLLGTYVEVEIEGREADNVVELDRSALRGGDTVYVMKPDSTLEKRKVEVLWRQENVVLVSAGVKPGEKIVVSPLASAVDGMKLRVPKKHSKAADPNRSAPATSAPKRAKAAAAKSKDEQKAGTSL
jgi:RND family efflux transporter MFP subunit